MTKRYNVRCKFCGNNQIMETRKDSPLNVKRTCVYCGRTFIIYNSNGNSCIVNNNVIQEKLKILNDTLPIKSI